MNPNQARNLVIREQKDQAKGNNLFLLMLVVMINTKTQALPQVNPKLKSSRHQAQQQEAHRKTNSKLHTSIKRKPRKRIHPLKLQECMRMIKTEKGLEQCCLH